MSRIRSRSLSLLSAATLFAASPTLALDGAGNVVTPSPDGTCSITINLDPGTLTFVSLLAVGFTQSAGGSFFDGGLPSGANPPITPAALAGCGWLNARNIDPDGADGIEATDDRIGITFRAESSADGLTRDYEFAIDGVTGSVIIATATLVAAPPAPGGAAPANEQIATFLNQRSNQLVSSQPTLTPFLSGSGSGAFDATVTRGRARLNFATDPGQPVWLKFSAADIDEGTRDSTYIFGAAGAHIALSSDFIVGGMIELDYFDQEQGADSVDGTGWLVGPYFVSRLDGKQLYLEGKLLYGQSSNDISSGGVTGSFDSERFLAQLRLSGDMQYGTTRLIPSIQASYTSDEQDAYVDSTATTIAGQTVELGQLELGLDFEMPAPFYSGSGNMLLTGGVSAIGSYIGGSGDAPGVLPDYEGGRARVDLGIVYQGPAGGVLDVSTFYDGIGTGDYEAFGIEAGFNLNF